MPFRYALFLEDDEPADPAVFVTAAPDEGDVFMPRGGERFLRLVGIWVLGYLTDRDRILAIAAPEFPVGS